MASIPSPDPVDDSQSLADRFLNNLSVERLSPEIPSTKGPEAESKLALSSPPAVSQPKHLTCYFWLYGNCKWSDELCLYAHWWTGLAASAPQQVQEGRPAVAGRNATRAQPNYHNWRSVRKFNRLQPHLQHQINHIQHIARDAQHPLFSMGGGSTDSTRNLAGFEFVPQEMAQVGGIQAEHLGSPGTINPGGYMQGEETTYNAMSPPSTHGMATPIRPSHYNRLPPPEPEAATKAKSHAIKVLADNLDGTLAHMAYEVEYGAKHAMIVIDRLAKLEASQQSKEGAAGVDNASPASLTPASQNDDDQARSVLRAKISMQNLLHVMQLNDYMVKESRALRVKLANELAEVGQTHLLPKTWDEYVEAGKKSSPVSPTPQEGQQTNGGR